MASYKIYFLDFCHQNQTLDESKRPLVLQNAISGLGFMKNVIFVASDGAVSDAPAVEQLLRSPFVRACATGFSSW